MGLTAVRADQLPACVLTRRRERATLADVQSRILAVVLALAAGLTAGACGHTPVIHRDDPVLDD